MDTTLLILALVGAVGAIPGIIVVTRWLWQFIWPRARKINLRTGLNILQLGAAVAGFTLAIFSFVALGARNGENNGPPLITPTGTQTHTLTVTATATPDLTAVPPQTVTREGIIAGQWAITGSSRSFRFTLREKVDRTETYDYTETRGDFIGVTFIGGGRAVLDGTSLRMDGVDDLGAYEAELELVSDNSMTGSKMHESEGESVITIVRVRE